MLVLHLPILLEHRKGRKVDRFQRKSLRDGSLHDRWWFSRSAGLQAREHALRLLIAQALHQHALVRMHIGQKVGQMLRCQGNRLVVDAGLLAQDLRGQFQFLFRMPGKGRVVLGDAPHPLPRT